MSAVAHLSPVSASSRETWISGNELPNSAELLICFWTPLFLYLFFFFSSHIHE